MQRMTIQTAIDNLMVRFGRFGATREILTKAMIDGVENFNLSVESAYHNLRLALGHELAPDTELFSTHDVACMLDISETEANRMIQDMIDEKTAEGEDITQFVKYHTAQRLEMML